ncbi:uncharacterized protein K02A2.6-like isoform X1 [Phlebotomus papatasi]|uniref:uncharacterized protein K02A2.6-like isoform X1 n=1 Tax=Phlebotomus papatasi TaxID=29031 RepID=UPI002483E442|nr:uncharacterized protein K02A2.6-like isoform X1 [Phlebotomus papatasi]
MSVAENSTRSNNGGFIGSIGEYCPEDDFVIYCERLEKLFFINNIEDDKMKCALFISFVGQNIYKVLKSALHPQTVDSQTYSQLVAVLKEKYSPAKNVITERYRFYKREQSPEESIRDYVVALQQLAESCEFGDFLQQALRDKFVMGIYEKKIQERLLALDKGFEETVKVARASELATSSMGEMRASVDWVSQGKSRGGRQGGKKRVNRESSDQGTHEKKRKVQCYRCHEWGSHYAANCPKKGAKSKKRKQVNFAEEESEDEDVSGMMSAMFLNSVKDEGSSTLDSDMEVYVPEREAQIVLSDSHNGATVSMCRSECKAQKNLFIAEYLNTVIDHKRIKFEIDTGACISCMHESFYRKFFAQYKLMKCDLTLSVVTGDRLCILGYIIVTIFVKVNGLQREFQNMKLVIFSGPKVFFPLCGRNWLNKIFPRWREMFNGSIAFDGGIFRLADEQKILQKFSRVFKCNEEDSIRDLKAVIVVKEDCVPIFHKPYAVPYGIRDKVEAEIRRLVKSKVLVPVDHSDWASPIVVVPKKDGAIRICVDCKVTVNKVVKTAHYPLPTLQEIFNKITGSCYFCVLDLTGAYQQLEVTPECRKFLTINTHIGLFQFTRLIFGLSSSPAIFQKTIDGILQGIPKTAAYIDDIIVGGSSKEECRNNLIKVLERLSNFNVKVNKKKCVFFQENVEFLGHVLSGEGVRPMKSKLIEIDQAQRPRDVTSLKAYLGLLTYYGKFIKNLSMKLAPLYSLLKAGTTTHLLQ